MEACRVPGDDHARAWDTPVRTNIGAAGNQYISDGTQHTVDISQNRPSGRWPANLIHDGSDEATEGMGDASRYFYCAKANKRDRDEGLSVDTRTTDDGRTIKIENPYLRCKTERKNHHPTVKPTDLMAYLCRLITPPGGTVLDPFNGSGSTGKAAVREGFNYIGCELDPEYVEIAKARIASA